MKKRSILYLICIVAAMSLFMLGCSGDQKNANKTSGPSGRTQSPGSTTDPEDPPEETINGVSFSKTDLNSSWTEEGSVLINFKGTDSEIIGTGAAKDGKKIVISSEGTYILSGTLDDGQIIVDVDKSLKVQLVLNGASIKCSDSAAIHIKSTDKVIITLADGTTNTLTDSVNYVFEAGETKPNACLYSADDITINGNGTLNVNAGYNNGISTNNDLKIISGTINVNAINNGVKGEDSVVIRNGTVNVFSEDDGIKADNEVDEGEGCVYIFGGTVNIEAGDDSVQAYTKVNITDAKVTAKSGGKNINCTGEVDVKEGSFTER